MTLAITTLKSLIALNCLTIPTAKLIPEGPYRKQVPVCGKELSSNECQLKLAEYEVEELKAVINHDNNIKKCEQLGDKLTEELKSGQECEGK